MKNQDCNNSIKRLFPKINIEEIQSFINSIPCIIQGRKDFYNNIIMQRYEIIKSLSFKFENRLAEGVPVVAQLVTNPTSIHEDAGSIPDLTLGQAPIGHCPKQRCRLE